METHTEATTRLQVRLPKELHKRFKIVQAHDGRSMNAAVVQMIEAWVAKQESGKGGTA